MQSPVSAAASADDDADDYNTPVRCVYCIRVVDVPPPVNHEVERDLTHM